MDLAAARRQVTVEEGEGCLIDSESKGTGPLILGDTAETSLDLAGVEVFDLAEYLSLGKETDKVSCHSLPLVVSILLVLVVDLPRLVDVIQRPYDNFDPLLAQVLRVAAEKVDDHCPHGRLDYFLQAEHHYIGHLMLRSRLEDLYDIRIVIRHVSAGIQCRYLYGDPVCILDGDLSVVNLLVDVALDDIVLTRWI